MKTIIDSSSLTFVATFADGTITRMTTNCSGGKSILAEVFACQEQPTNRAENNSRLH